MATSSHTQIFDQTQQTRRITVRRVLEATAEHYGTTVPEILARTRKQPVVRRRQMAMYVAKKLTGRSLPFIARHMGGWDHTTVLHAVRAVEGRLARPKAVAAVEAIVAQVTGGANV